MSKQYTSYGKQHLLTKLLKKIFSCCASGNEHTDIHYGRTRASEKTHYETERIDAYIQHSNVYIFEVDMSGELNI